MTRLALRFSVACLLLALACAPVRTGRAEEVPEDAGTESPVTVEELKRRLDALMARLTELVELANKDPLMRRVEQYLNYRIEDFKDRKRPVKAKDLVEIMAEAEDFQTREAALNALLSERARSFDPDLVRERGQRQPRKEFSYTHVTPLLRSDDRLTRQLAHTLLVESWGKPLDPDIVGFKPATATKQERRKAYEAWRKHLRK